MWYNESMEIPNWLKEWALPGATFLLAIVAFWNIWQNYRFRREDRNRERIVRSTDELCRWVEESLKLSYLPYNYNNEEIYNSFSELSSKSVAMVGTASIIGHEFFEITTKTEEALSNYYSAIKARRNKHNKQVDKSVLEEFGACFNGLQFYLSLLRVFDYDYDAFIKFARSHDALPLSEHLQPSDFRTGQTT